MKKSPLFPFASVKFRAYGRHVLYTNLNVKNTIADTKLFVGKKCNVNNFMKYLKNKFKYVSAIVNNPNI